MNVKSTQAKSSTVTLLEHLYQALAAESDTVRALLPKIPSESANFKSDLTLCLTGCESLAARANALMSEACERTLEDSLMNQMTARVTSALGTLMDDSVSHMAEMMLQYATSAMVDAVRRLREFENSTASEASLALARDVIKHEEDQAEKMKQYL